MQSVSMINVLIIDDEEHVRIALIRLLNICNTATRLIGAFSQVSEALKTIAEQKPDLVLLDVEMGDESGFDLFAYIPKPDFKVIFITGHEHYAVKAFRFAAMDFLLKPVDPDLLADALNKLSDQLDREKQMLVIESLLSNQKNAGKASKKVVLKTADNIHVVNLRDIMYCQAARSYTIFYLADKSRVLVSVTLGEYEELFDGYGFIRIHQSYLVNLDHIKRFEKNDGGKVILADGSSVPVATRKKDQLLQKLSEL